MDPSVTFLFPGVGDEYAGMGRELHERAPVFRAALEECAAILRPALGLDIRDSLFGTPPVAGEGIDLAGMLGRGDRPRARPLPARLVHPILLSVEIALARLWMSRGVRPSSLIGYSLGEYAAACLAGVFSLHDGLLLVARRAELVEEQPPGVMVAVSLSEAELRRLLAGTDVDLAVVSGPAMCVAAGPPDAVAALERRLEEEEVATRRVDTRHAFHSRQMAGLARSFQGLVERLPLSPPRIPMVSNGSGTWLTDGEATSPAYWARHLASTVRFSDCLRAAAVASRVFVEVGPGQTLSVLVRLNGEGGPPPRTVSSLPSVHDRAPDAAHFERAAAALRAAGVPVELDRERGPLGRERGGHDDGTA